MPPSRFQIQQAAKAIKNQGVIAYPTESVYGLGCNPLCEKAVNKILQLKRRPIKKGLILIASNFKQLAFFTDLSLTDKEKIRSNTAAQTWLVKKSTQTPLWICGEHSKVAIRVSQHPIVKALCNEAGMAIVSTSANTANSKSAASLLQVRQYFPTQLDFYLPGSTGSLSKATPIIDLETSEFIRD